jgi:hypothetical protein
VKGAATGHSPRSYFSPVGHEAAEKSDILIIQGLFFHAEKTRSSPSFSKLLRLRFSSLSSHIASDRLKWDLVFGYSRLSRRRPGRVLFFSQHLNIIRYYFGHGPFFPCL